MKFRVPDYNLEFDMPNGMQRQQQDQFIRNQLKSHRDAQDKVQASMPRPGDILGSIRALREPSTSIPSPGIKAGLTADQAAGLHRQLLGEAAHEQRERIANRELSIRQQNANTHAAQVEQNGLMNRIRLGDMLRPRPDQYKTQFDSSTGAIYRINETRGTVETLLEGRLPEKQEPKVYGQSGRPYTVVDGRINYLPGYQAPPKVGDAQPPRVYDQTGRPYTVVDGRINYLPGYEVPADAGGPNIGVSTLTSQATQRLNPKYIKILTEVAPAIGANAFIDPTTGSFNQTRFLTGLAQHNLLADYNAEMGNLVAQMQTGAVPPFSLPPVIPQQGEKGAIPTGTTAPTTTEGDSLLSKFKVPLGQMLGWLGQAPLSSQQVPAPTPAPVQPPQPAYIPEPAASPALPALSPFPQPIPDEFIDIVPPRIPLTIYSGG